MLFAYLDEEIKNIYTNDEEDAGKCQSDAAMISLILEDVVNQVSITVAQVRSSMVVYVIATWMLRIPDRALGTSKRMLRAPSAIAFNQRLTIMQGGLRSKLLLSPEPTSS